MTADHARCERFIEALTAGQLDDDAAVLAAITVHGITRADFVALDETPAMFDIHYRRNGWHAALRRVRNNGNNDLFERLA